jgi:hypothetical protein
MLPLSDLEGPCGLVSLILWHEILLKSDHKQESDFAFDKKGDNIKRMIRKPARRRDTSQG